MNEITCRRGVAIAGWALASLVVTACPLLARGQQQTSSQGSTGDPVADAARKAREQKKQDAAKPKKVYTDEDLRHVAPTPPTAAADAAATDENAAKNTDAQGSDASGKPSGPEDTPEAKWRKQFKEAYEKLDRAQLELDVLQREASKALIQYYSDPQKALEEQYTRKDINEKDAKIAAKKKEVDDLKQKISDMEEALRKSGGDPGWASR